jgi:GST-like protein
VIKLFGATGSGSAVIEVALQWCGVKYQIERAAQWEPESALDELARINPLKQIPTLVFEDGTVMSETAAILVELALRHSESMLLPTEPRARAKALRGLAYISANCYAAVSVSDYPERWNTHPNEASNESVRQAARVQLHHFWDVFADLFAVNSTTAYLVADVPCALDIFAAVVSKWSGSREHLKIARPELFALLLRIESHPKIAPVFKQHWGAA